MRLQVRRLLPSIITIAALALTPVACYKLYEIFAFEVLMSGLKCSEGNATLKEIEYGAHVTFPRSASDIKGVHGGGHRKYCDIYARFTVDAVDFNSFVAATRVKLPLSSMTTSQAFSIIQRVFREAGDPNGNYLWGSGPQSLDYTQNILVNTADPLRYTVYVIASYEGI
jgi:hypothetical protein